MAELIPMEYRIHAARQRLILRWSAAVLAVALLAAAGIAFSVRWEHERGAVLTRLVSEYSRKTTLITRAKALRATRLDLAARMAKIQQLMDDKTLLLLLQNISSSFSNDDCLDYVSIDAHGARDARPDDPNRFVVRINGITASSTTLTELMARLEKTAKPAMAVTLESSRREALLDGQVMRFQIVCEKPPSSGT